MTFFTFLDRIDPAHSMAKPGCMKNTMDPAQMRKKVSRLVPTSDPLVWAAAMACRCDGQENGRVWTKRGPVR
jgi:hypothetical protein